MQVPDAVVLLIRRGFLIDALDNRYYLNDNAHPKDREFLGKILCEYDIGYVDGNLICIDNTKNACVLERLFDPCESIRMEMCWNTSYQWMDFVRFQHGKKVAVENLEPNVAYYCKAVSACGLDTISSCDGNHGMDKATWFVRYSNQAYSFWHQVLWELILKQHFSLPWNAGYTDIYLNTANRANVYQILFQAADYLYQNRIIFRRFKYFSSKFITKSYQKRHDDEAIKEALYQSAVGQLSTGEYQFPLTECQAKQSV